MRPGTLTRTAFTVALRGLRRIQQKINEDELKLFGVGTDDDVSVRDVEVRCRVRGVLFEKSNGTAKQILEYPVVATIAA